MTANAQNTHKVFACQKKIYT